MPWLKQVGCDCPECGPDPCTGGCPCVTDISDVGTEFDLPYAANFDVTGDFPVAQILSSDLDATTGGAGLQFVLKANGVVIDDSGCLEGTGAGSFTVPAGTTTLRVEITQCDASIEVAWGFRYYCP